MNTTEDFTHRPSTGHAAMKLAQQVVSGLWAAVRLTLYSVLAVLEPVIIWAVTVTTLVCLAMSLIYGTLIRGTHFPFAFVLGLAAASALSLVVYYGLMELLLPEDADSQKRFG